jgi:hypothetical protein
MKPAAIGARRASVLLAGDLKLDGPEDKPSHRSLQAIRADLIGSDTCIALGLAINSSSPVLALCRALVESGHDPAIALEAYRGDVLCLRVRSIGEGAELEINGKGSGFKRRAAVGIAPLVRANGGGGS